MKMPFLGDQIGSIGFATLDYNAQRSQKHGNSAVNF